MARVELHGVSLRYGTQTALHPLDLGIAEGEFLTLLGPSGCGKTTTLRLIAGFLQPSTGRITFDGTEVGRLPPNRRGIGMVFQDYALFPHLSVADNIGFGLVERGQPRAAIRARVAELAELVQLRGLEQRFPAQLSGGQRQRVALARAVAHPPRVLLMDEPLGALDLALREQMQAEIQAFQRRLGITTLYVTHDQTEAIGLSDRIAVMRAGRVVQLADAATLYNRPRSAFVARFFGRANLLPARPLPGGAEVLGRPIRIAAPAPEGLLRPGFAIRPEQWRLAPPGEPPADLNALPARIVGLHYLGSVTRCTLHAADGTPLLVEAAPDDPLLVPGAEVSLRWPPGRGALLELDDPEAPP